MKLFWIRNTSGEPSASLTLIVIAFSIIMLHMLASIFVNPFGIAIAPFDAAAAMLVLTPLLGLYFGRRYTASKEKENHRAIGIKEKELNFKLNASLGLGSPENEENESEEN